MSPRPLTSPRKRRTASSVRVVLAALVVALAVLAGATPGAGALPATTHALLRPPVDNDPPEPPEPPEEPPAPEPEPEPDPEPPPPPAPECGDVTGLPRPAGDIAPGFVYSPTDFDGSTAVPQPDDTFIADAPGHQLWVGTLRTRNNGGREEILICAHVGTNTADDALTAFATTGPAAHPATIAPRVMIIDGNGATSTYEMTTPGIESSLSHYRDSTDVHAGYLQMWVPFTPNLREPGFGARVEIRGTAALPGGASNVMGADEVYVHMGPRPLAAGQTVDDAIGLAIDDGAIGERPEDPGADDLSALLGPVVAPDIDAGIEAQVPKEIDDSWAWSEDWETIAFSAGGTVKSLTTAITGVSFDVENFNESEGRLVANITGTVYPRMDIRLRSIGLFSASSGACEAYATVPFHAKVAFLLNVADDRVRPEIDVLFVQPSATVASYGVSGKISGWYGIFVPGTYDCSNLSGKIGAGIVENVDRAMQDLPFDEETNTKIETALHEHMGPLDLEHGAVSTVNTKLPSGVGFQLLSPRYTPTRPSWGIGGEMFTSSEGVNLAAGFTAYDLGNPGRRFPYSYVPTSTGGVVPQTFTRSRPGGGSFDLGVVVNGATVNQLSRAVTAGGYAAGSGLLDLSSTVFGIPVTVRPSVAPLYLPTAPQGWPTPGTLNVSVPSVRLALTGPTIASVAADVRTGLDVRIDGNRLDPVIVQAQVAPRFLRLRSDVNVLSESQINLSGVPAQITQRVASVVSPITIPDLSNDLGTHVHPANLTAVTVGGGHLGLFVDVDPGWAATPPPMATTTFTPSAPNGAPATFTTVVAPTGFPGNDPYSVHWTAKDSSGAVVYESPTDVFEPTLTKTFPASGLAVSTDPCDGTKSVSVSVTVVVRRGFNERTETSSGFYSWAGEPPAHPPRSCFPEPEPDPEPDPPIPPVCRVKPWLCEDL